MEDRHLKQDIVLAVEKLVRRLGEYSPWFQNKVSNWMDHLSPQGPVKTYFSESTFFPHFWLSRWMANTFAVAKRDRAFEFDIVYATLNALLHTFLLDRVSDGHCTTTELELLPAMAFFQMEMFRAYQSHFENTHPFWNELGKSWFVSNEVMTREHSVQNVELDGFQEILKARIAFTKIPLLATAYKYEQEEVLTHWFQFCDLLGLYCQATDDLLDWYIDWSRGGHTYFLSEYSRRKQPEESMTGWVVREGFAWGLEFAQNWISEAQKLVEKDALNSTELRAYLKELKDTMSKELDNTLLNLRRVKRQAEIIAGRQS